MAKRRGSNEADRRPRSKSSSSADFVPGTPSKRRANVYDAVAGNVTQAGIVGHFTDAKASKQPLRPDEVLFKQSNAPIRYEETDYYYAHARLPADQKLPSGDLLTALHAYISKLYSRTAEDGTEKTWKCMDETALIALGILMEETAKETLGETGDLAFTEAADEEEEKALADERKNDEQGSSSPPTKPKPTDAENEEHLQPYPSSEDGSGYNSTESD